MKEQEGVIKYHLEHFQKSIDELFSFNEISAWRAIIYRLGLIGKDPDLYENLGFGNISQRLNPKSSQFIISGTQTGHIEYLNSNHYALVIKSSPQENCVQSCGLSQPSSEALTHSVLYSLDSNIQAVIHVHSSEIWRQTSALNLPHVTGDISYGTVEMAIAVKNLYQSGKFQQSSVFTMLGHEDGVFSFGKNVEEAASELIKHLSLAIANKYQ